MNTETHADEPAAEPADKAGNALMIVRKPDEWVILDTGKLMLAGTQYIAEWYGMNHTIEVTWAGFRLGGADSMEDVQRIVDRHRKQLITFGIVP